MVDEAPVPKAYERKNNEQQVKKNMKHTTLISKKNTIKTLTIHDKRLLLCYILKISHYTNSRCKT